MNRLLPILTAVLILLPGCSQVGLKKRSTSKTKLIRENQEVSDSFDERFIKEQEAKLIDIPVPLNAQSVPSLFSYEPSNDGYSLGYIIHIQLEELKKFYIQEMESLGWKKYVSVHGIEDIIVFEKPMRVCIFSFRPRNKNILLMIFTAKR